MGNTTDNKQQNRSRGIILLLLCATRHPPRTLDRDSNRRMAPLECHSVGPLIDTDEACSCPHRPRFRA